MARPRWKMTFSLLRRIVELEYPIEVEDSLWWNFRDRVLRGDGVQRSEFAKQFEKMQAWDDAEELAADVNGLRTRVTRVMHAALWVSMWAEVEKQLTRVARELLRAFPTMQKRPKGNFGELDRVWQNHAGRGFRDTPGFTIVNALRVVNDCFKHHSGIYDSASTGNGRIDPDLAAKWQMLAENDEPSDTQHYLCYENVPLEDAVHGCREFLLSLIAEAERVVCESWVAQQSDPEGY